MSGSSTSTLSRTSTLVIMHFFWQRARYNKMIHLRSLDSIEQAGPLCERPWIQEATRAPLSLQYAAGQGVLYIPVWSRTRQPTHWIQISKNSWNGCVFTGRSTLRNRNIQNANNNHHLQAGHQAQHGGVRHLGNNIGKNGTLMGGKTKNGETKVRTTLPDSRSK